MLIVKDPGKPFEVRDADLEGVEDTDPDTVYTLRPLTRDTILEIEAKHTKRRPNRVTHQMEDVLDQRAALEDKLDYILLDWAGVVYESGEPVPCTRDAKLACINGARQVALFRLADVNRVDKAARAATFREPAAVGRVLGR